MGSGYQNKQVPLLSSPPQLTSIHIDNDCSSAGITLPAQHLTCPFTEIKPFWFCMYMKLLLPVCTSTQGAATMYRLLASSPDCRT